MRLLTARPPALVALVAAAVACLATLTACGSGAEAGSGPATGTTDESSVTAAPSEETSPDSTDGADAEGSGTSGGGTSERGEKSGKADSAVQPGVYLTWADYEADPGAVGDRRVVLFFHADWCHSCRGTEASIDRDGLPDGLALVKVDYDSATDLRQQYGVTVQHTFVQVDDAGSKVGIWTGSPTGADILARTV